MKREWSTFGQRFTQEAGILSLMEDLGNALAEGGDKLMLGGGNPAPIPELQAEFRAQMETLLRTPGEFERLVGNYDPPRGNERFIRALVELLNSRYRWDLSPANIALTPGSQASFFSLFNLLGGHFSDGSLRRILFPLTPEYIGYADVGAVPDLFLASRSVITKLDNRLFKYGLDRDALASVDNIGAVCVSRPTNPTGNVIADAEVDELLRFARAHRVPLIIDSAYGAPFPNILFLPVIPIWNEDIVLCMSLSKLGLPGTRTGIVIARPELIKALTSVNAILNLANANLGPMLAQNLAETGALIDLGNTIIRPFYEARAQRALAWLHESLAGLDYYIHKPEGAIFLWIWFPRLPISSQELYERLKQRGVLIVSGHYFFPGLREPWPHTRECIRVTYSQAAASVERGIQIIGEEVRRAWDAAA
jgi:valine--pyruvate aminotransferase